VRGTYRRGLDGHYSREINGGVTPATVSRNGERGRRLREEGDDMRGPPVSEGREVRGYRFGAGRCWAMGSFWPWAGRVPGVQFHIFLFFFLFIFYFLISFIEFAKESSNSIQTTFRDFTKITARF
jgi:hypothetical protein